MFKLKRSAYAELMRQRGLKTYAQKAAAAGIGQGTAYRIEKGGTVGPKVADRLIRAYGVPFDELFEVVDMGEVTERIVAGLAA